MGILRISLRLFWLQFKRLVCVWTIVGDITAKNFWLTLKKCLTFNIFQTLQWRWTWCRSHALSNARLPSGFVYVIFVSSRMWQCEIKGRFPFSVKSIMLLASNTLKIARKWRWNSFWFPYNNHTIGNQAPCYIKAVRKTDFNVIR